MEIAALVYAMYLIAFSSEYKLFYYTTQVYMQIL